ncbi:GatB/YqeY domain-containing protein [Candidatus Gottesmanbacteria bacterium]|nr:GatB/YqeY domain-containing protein [Candidatus Gottesmanbacteria bacterium]
MLLDDIKTTITSALKAGDHRKLDTLRFLLAAIRNSAIAKYGAQAETNVTEQDVLEVIKKQTKTHRESVEAFTKAGRSELAAKESEELAILEAYLPKQLTDDEIKALLTPVIPSGESNFGKLMGLAMAAVKGQADGGRVAAILKQLLSAS